MIKESNYVYIHRRKTDGTIFYVGMGVNDRPWSRHGRGKWWKSIVKKNGFYTEICQSGMSRADAALLEMWIIAKLRHEGVTLCNITDGGDGCVGKKMTRGERIKISRSQGGRVVYCSNGMLFQTASEAAEWCSEILDRTCHPGPIATCCKDKSRTAYGYAWSFNRVPDEPKGIGSYYISRPVSASNGMIFNSAAEASEWVIGNINKSACSSCILKASKSEHKSAYGLFWSLGDNPDDAIKKSKRNDDAVISSDGKYYENVRSAGEYLVKIGKYKTLRSAVVSIYLSIKTERRTAGGLRWKKHVDIDLSWGYKKVG